MPPLTSSNPPTSLTSSNSSNHIHIQTLTPSPHPPHHQHHPTCNSHLDQGRRTEQKSNNLFKLSNLVSRSCVRNKFNNINQPTRIFCFSWRILLPKGQLCFLAIVRVPLPHTCVLMPHGTVAQLREPHCKVSAAIFESHLQSIPSCFKAGVNFQGDNDQVLSVLHQLASEDDNVVEEEDTDGKVFLDTSCRPSCQDQPV